ncbi:FecR family protein [Flavobacterium sp. ZB4P23]|nr:FecR family protein [Flavobacterium sp. ZB4P23]RTY94847.1 FecR family protein [Flavobacterium sp. GSN2]
MQNRNNYIEIGDFLADESFKRWVLQQNDQQNWELWTLENPVRAKLVEEARVLIFAMKVPADDLSADAVQTALEATWHKIENKKKTTRKTKVLFLRNNWIKGIAATLVFGLISTWFYHNFFNANDGELNYNELIKENSDGLLEQTNNSNKSQVIILSDGSSVLLQPKSKLSYPKIFVGNERKVYLSGEGFFEISKDAKKPFLVYSNEIITKVIGTSFRIKSYENDSNVEVIVRTGIVKIHSNKSAFNSTKKEVILLPNQALRYGRKTLIFNKITNITQDESLTSALGDVEKLSFEFTDIPVVQIFRTIEQAYLVDIDFPENKLKECHITTSLTDQPLSEKLKIICESIGNNTTYQMNGNQISIQSIGCN